ncbi:MAG: hypothetical protein KGJ80_00100 [Chloroflexota bacterium]|nr:hypothetical protein [Chloroflexota bacterium]
MEIRFFIYGALGWCSEILWTAITRKVTRGARDWLLVGETSLWAFPLYGLIAFLYEPLHDALRAQFVLVRAAVYLAGFWVIEYIGGWLVWKIVGKKPWDYSKSPGGSLHGLVRWNFVLVWSLVGLGLEPLHDFLVRLTPAIEQALR